MFVFFSRLSIQITGIKLQRQIKCFHNPFDNERKSRAACWYVLLECKSTSGGNQQSCRVVHREQSTAQCHKEEKIQYTPLSTSVEQRWIRWTIFRVFRITIKKNQRKCSKSFRNLQKPTKRLNSRARPGQLLQRSNRKHPDWKHHKLAWFGQGPRQEVSTAGD